MRRAARSRSDRGGRRRSRRKRACSTPTRTSRARCARRKMRTIIATSPTRTCCRSSSTRRSSTNAARRCPSCPTPSASATRGWAITPYNAGVLTAEVETARWFDALLEAGARARSRRRTGSSPSCSARSTGSARRIDDYARFRRRRRPNCSGWSPTARSRGTIAKQVFEIMLETGDGAAEDRREARAQADQRHRRDRRGDRQDPRRQRRQGRRV